MGSRSAHEGEQGAPEGIVVEPPLSFFLLESLLPIRGGELEDAASGPLGQEVEQVAEVGPRLDVVHLAACDEGDEDGVGNRALLGSYEDPILSSDRLAAQVSLRDVVGQRQPAVVEKALERLLLVQRI